MKFSDELKAIGACESAIEWVGHCTLAEAWADCPRGDWMIWLAMRMAGKPGWASPQDVVEVLCDIAEQMAHIPSEKRLFAALKTVLRWCIGDADILDVREAYTAASNSIASNKSASAIGAPVATINIVASVISVIYGDADAAAHSAADAVSAATATADDADAAAAAAAVFIRRRLTIGAMIND